MMNSTKLYQIDEAFVRRVAAIVVQRLKDMLATESNPLPHKVISEQHILETHPGSTLTVRSDALITPLAKDTAKDRNITLSRSQDV